MRWGVAFGVGVRFGVGVGVGDRGLVDRLKGGRGDRKVTRARESGHVGEAIGIGGDRESSIGETAVMAAGVTDRLWSIGNLIEEASGNASTQRETA